MGGSNAIGEKSYKKKNLGTLKIAGRKIRQDKQEGRLGRGSPPGRREGGSALSSGIKRKRVKDGGRIVQED